MLYIVVGCIFTPYTAQAPEQKADFKTMDVAEELPTIFASTLGEECGLLVPREQGMDHDKYNNLVDRMTWFQQMAVTSTFEDCVAVYFGIKLSKDQLGILKLIHRTTKPWMTGHIVGVCMKKIKDGAAANRDFAESVRVLVEQIEEKPGVASGKVQGIMVKSTLTDKANRKSAKSRRKK